MQRVRIAERAQWRARAEEAGFRFHTIDGQPYWDETAYYAFTLRQIEQDIEDPSAELHQGGVVDEVLDPGRDREQLGVRRDQRPVHGRPRVVEQARVGAGDQAAEELENILYRA